MAEGDAYSLPRRLHPMTCPSRGDGAHLTDEDGQLGVLARTRDGWRCPICGYTQSDRPSRRVVFRSTGQME